MGLHGDVEIDESVFGRRIKYHVGNPYPGMTVWILGLVERVFHQDLFCISQFGKFVLILLSQIGYKLPKNVPVKCVQTAIITDLFNTRIRLYLTRLIELNSISAVDLLFHCVTSFTSKRKINL